MITKIYEQRTPDFEVIERKGKGHPDTLADALADELSNVYSKFTKKHFGAILHHNFDKLNILGGKSYVKFGKSHMVNSIRVVINGRATSNFGEQKIDVENILKETTYNFFEERFGEYITRKDIRIIYEVTTSSTVGAVHSNNDEINHRHKWFEPDSLKDLPELIDLTCNDTSVGCYTPRSKLGKFVLNIENLVHTSSFNEDGKFGTDIKIMAVRHKNEVNITMALPMIATKIHSMNQFIQEKENIYNLIENEFKKLFPKYIFSLTINPGDNYDSGDIYLAHLGSCIETGDEGLVGRGNRVGGLIQVNCPMSMEGACGKNPVYYTGKVLTAIAYEIGEELSSKINDNRFTIYLIGQRRKSLKRPWKMIIEGPQDLIDKHIEIIEEVFLQKLDDAEQTTQKLINNKIPLY